MITWTQVGVRDCGAPRVVDAAPITYYWTVRNTAARMEHSLPRCCRMECDRYARSLGQYVEHDNSNKQLSNCETVHNSTFRLRKSLDGRCCLLQTSEVLRRALLFTPNFRSLETGAVVYSKLQKSIVVARWAFYITKTVTSLLWSRVERSTSQKRRKWVG